MMDWLIMALLLMAVAALVVVILRARKTVTDMQTSVKETVKEALEQAQKGFESASNKALYEQQAEARGKLDITIDKSLSPVRDELTKAREEINKYSQQARESAINSGSAHAEMMRSISNLGTKAETLSAKAETLSDALRGDVKMMGDWGENTLDQILELSGLEKGVAYEKQASVKAEDGKQERPDILLKLPKDGEGKEKVIAIDSKVSLAGYLDYVRAGDDEESRQAGLAKLLEKVKEQAEETAKYKKIEGRETPGFALMFMPVEPAWELVQRHQDGKFIEGLQRSQGVIILGPTNLMVSLHMVSHLWRGYKQDKNVKEIADIGGKMLDAVERAFDRFEKLSNLIDSSQTAAKHLKDSLTGSQGVGSYAEKMRKLGAKGKKEGDSSRLG